MPVPYQIVVQAAADQPSVWSTLGPALIVAVAALFGIAVGALLEPTKLRYAHRARIRQERLTQCARLIEAATRVDALWKALVKQSAAPPSVALEAKDTSSIHRELDEQRTVLHSANRLISMYGPPELETLAKVVTTLDQDNHKRLYEQKALSTDVIMDMADAIESFVVKAREETH